jgi:hypothetical protein
MTRHKTLQCVHEPFGDAYYFGPERLAERYESDPEARKESGYADSTYRTIFDRIAKENSEVRTYVSGLWISISHAFHFHCPIIESGDQWSTTDFTDVFLVHHDLRHARLIPLHSI